MFASYAFYESTYQCLLDLKRKFDDGEQEDMDEREKNYRKKCFALMQELIEEWEKLPND